PRPDRHDPAACLRGFARAAGRGLSERGFTLRRRAGLLLRRRPLYRSGLSALRPQGDRLGPADHRGRVDGRGRDPAARGDRLLRHDPRARRPPCPAGRQRRVRLPHPGLRHPRLRDRGRRHRFRPAGTAGPPQRPRRGRPMAVTQDKPVLALDHLRKEFGGNVALQDFSLELRAGEIVALGGDNGARKPTLVKISAGVHQPTAGTIAIDGAPVSFADASAARRHGIEVVYQDLALADSQPVYMNLFLGRELVRGPLRRLDKKAMAEQTQNLVNELDVRIPSVRATIRELSGGQRQGVAIARATHWATKLVLMDEPTAALGVAETAKVEAIIQGLRARDLAILIVSHNLDQVFRIADRVCVLRRGVQVGWRPIAQTTGDEIIAMITGMTKS